MAIKVGVDIRSLVDSQPTGVGTYTRMMVNSLQAVAPELELKLYASGSQQRSLRDLGIAEESGTSLTWVAKPNKVLNARSFTLGTPLLDRAVGGADVWFSPNINFTNLSPHVPHVLTVHDLSYHLFPGFFSGKRRAWHAATRAAAMVAGATHVVCDSHSTAQDVQRVYGLTPEQTSVVWLGKDLVVHPTQSEIQSVSAELQLPKEYVVAIGAIEPRKNLVGLVQALEEVAWARPELGLVLIGPYGWKNGALKRAIASSYLADRIHVLGYLEAKHKSAVLAQAKLLYCASSYEGFGLPVLEAMQLGVPVVTSNVSSLPEIAGEAAVLVDPERVDQCAQALLEVLRDSDAQDVLRKRGRARAQRFTWQDAALEMANVLRAVAEQGVGSVKTPVIPVEVV